MFCPNCGVALSRAPDFCPGCRKDLRPLHTLFRASADSNDGTATSVTSLPEATAVDEGATALVPPSAAPTPPHADAGATFVMPPVGSVEPDEATRIPVAGGGAPRHDEATRITPDSGRVVDSDVTRFTPSRPTLSTRSVTKRTPSGSGEMSSEGPLYVGQMLGTRYHIIRLLGIGGMGAVYQAWDSELEVALAFKVIRQDVSGDPNAAAEIERRFKRELLLARQVTHPNVVRIHDLGEFEGIKYITMPYIEGKDLSDVLAETGTLPVPRALAIAKQVVSGLCAAHRAGIVHRDLKPANIMIDSADDRALIMDFGIARTASGPADQGGAGASLGRHGSAAATRVGTIVGTIEYMAPEQARGDPVDHRADIYAFGLILYRTLVGKRLMPGATDAFTDLTARMQAEPPRLRQVEASMPVAVDEIVSTCLQPDAGARYQTTEELLAALERLDENGIPLPDPPPLWRSWRFWATAASVTVALVATTWWSTLRLAGPTVEVQHEPVSVLIADFTNETGDPMFNGLLEQSLGVGVEAASFVTAYDRRNALRVAAQLNAGKTLDANVARLVAQREGVSLVLTGGVASDGSGYKLAVRSINPADGQTTLSTEIRASSKNEVLNAMGRLSGRVRESLGDTKTARNPAENEMLSAASLEAVAEYIAGQELTRQSRDEEAIAHFKRATELDPRFGRAYSAWGTAAFKIGRQAEAETQHTTAMSLLDRMTERERYRTLGVYYLATTKNFDKAIENFETLVKLYPSDAPSYNNLAVAYTNKLDFPKAVEMGRKALAIYPKNRLYRSNFALYAMYAGDFKTAAAEANRLLAEDPKYFMGYLPLAIASLAGGDAAAARGYYEEMAKVNARAASLANIGLADVAIVQGETAEAISLLRAGIAADDEAKNEAGASAKRIALADAYDIESDQLAAVQLARAAVAASKSESILLSAGRIFAAARQQRGVDDVAKVLANQFEPQKRAYARVVDALDYIHRERYVDAADSLKEAIKFADLWIARFYLGVAYEIAGRHGEAISELEICQKRRGEATALFIDEVPTYRYLAPLPYWLARAQEGLGQKAQARVNYEGFLAQKRGDTNDPMVGDAKRRLASLPTN